MRKLLAVACLAGFVGGSVWAQELSPNYHWIERVGGALTIPNSLEVSSNLDIGFAGDIAMGYRLQRHLSFSIDTGYYQYNLKNQVNGYSGNFSYVPLIGVLTLNFTDESIRPYLSLAAGLAFNLYTQNASLNGISVMYNSYETSLLLAPGAGLMAIVDPQFAFFLEGRVDMNFRSNTSLGMASGMPSIFVPIQTGILFLVI